MAESGDLSPRIKSLERALIRAKELPKNTRLNTKQMCELVDVSSNSLREWCDSFTEFNGRKCFVRGGQGISWEFDPVKTITVLIEHFVNERKQRFSKTNKVAKDYGLETDSEPTANIGDLHKQVNLTLTLTEAKVKQGAYLPTTTVSHFLSGYNSAVVDGVLGVRSRIDSTGSLDPSISALIDEYLRNVAVSVSRKAEAFIREFDASFNQGGDSRNS